MKKIFSIAIASSITLSPFTGASPLGESSSTPLPSITQRQMSATYTAESLGLPYDSGAFLYLKSVLTPHLLAYHMRNLGIVSGILYSGLLRGKLVPQGLFLNACVFLVTANALIYWDKAVFMDNALETNFLLAAFATAFLGLF